MVKACFQIIFKNMLIGELAQKTGLSRDTIRFYEKQGIITVGRKQRRDNNYKEYSDEALERLQIAIRLKGFGFTLNEIVSTLQLIEEQNATCTVVSRQMQEKIDLIDARIKELLEVRSMILHGINNCQSCCTEVAENAHCGMLDPIA